MKRERTRRFIGVGGTRRGTSVEREQRALFADSVDDLDEASPGAAFDLGELDRDVNRMRLETSSNVYAQRRSTW